MNNQITRYVYTLVFLCGTYFICSLFFALLMFYSFLSFDTYESIASVLSILVWCSGGILLGRSLYNKALLCALPIIGIYVIVILGMFLLGHDVSVSDLSIIVARIIGFGLCTRLSMRT